MLTRSSQVGEFYVMSPPQIPPKGDGLHTCDLLVYDEESDRHVRITWEDALEATLINDAEGFYTAAADTTMADGNQNTTTLGSWADAARKWSTYNKGSGDYKAAAADGGIDVRIIIARPFIEHLMHNVVMTVAGRDTGATLFGPADMQLSANTQVKTIEGYANLLNTHTHTHTHTSLSMPWHGVSATHTHAGSAPSPNPCQALHRPLQGRGHQAAERPGHEGRRVRGLRRGHEHALVCQARERRRHVGRGRSGEHPGAPLVLQRRHRPLRLDARVPVLGGPVPERPARHRHVRDDAPAPVGGQQRGRRTPPSRAATRCLPSTRPRSSSARSTTART